MKEKMKLFFIRVTSFASTPTAQGL